jgi:hypothetical protein
MVERSVIAAQVNAAGRVGQGGENGRHFEFERIPSLPIRVDFVHYTPEKAFRTLEDQ